MKLPKQYENLNIDQKRVVVLNLIDEYWNKKYQETIVHLSNEQVEFLFQYFFTESKEEREKMWMDMRNKYEKAVKDLEKLTSKLQKLNLEFAELLAKRKDAEEFRENIKNNF